MAGETVNWRMLSENEGYRLLAEYGIPVPKYRVARTKEEAGTIASEIGFPVVMKVVSPDIIHKSDAGGVITGVTDRDSAERAFLQITARVRASVPTAEIQGVIVEQQMKKGLELIVGGKTDPAFGKVLTIGMGGTLVELLKDISLRVLPIDAAEIGTMLRELRSYPLFKGFRNSNPLDEKFAITTISAMAKLFDEHAEITEFDINPLILYESGGCSVDARFILTDRPRPEVSPDRTPVPDGLFLPRSIALVGASGDPGKVGYAILRNLLPFPGTLFPVNPKHREILGHKTYPSLTSLPDRVDVAIIAVPAPLVPQIVEEAGRKGIPLAIIVSSGFRESGPEGAAREEEVMRIARAFGMRIMGPNCLGLMVPAKHINTTFDPITPKPGKIAFISQSGAIITTIVDWSLPEEIGFSTVASVGNQADLGFEDFIGFALDDEATQAIILYVEEIRNGKSFIDRLKKVTDTKPVVALKSGSSRRGIDAAASHTGSLSGNYEVYQAAFHQAGIVPVTSLREAFQTAELLALEGYPKGNRAVVITNAGGFAVLASDYAERFGIELPPIPDPVHIELDRILPRDWNHRNPMDMIGDATAERFAKVFDILTNNQDFWDVAFVIGIPSATVDPMRFANEVVRFSKHTKKMIVGCMIGGDSMKAAFRILKNQEIPNFSDMEDAFRAVGNGWKVSKKRIRG